MSVIFRLLCVYYGVHHSQPPVGALRWQAPLPIEANNNFSSMGVINATQIGPTCIQGIPYWSNSTPGNPTGQEDCLRSDVYIPIKPISTALPIMVQVHGGGYTEGSSMSEPGDAIMAAANGSLVYVSTQYRLGAFGYLSSVEVRQNGSPNVGALDQRAGIQWTQRNARAIGGDPAKITIVGGSAGGGSMMDQLILYGGDKNPPFRAVIAQRTWWQPRHNDTVLESQYRRLLKETNCDNLACLRSLDQSTLANAAQRTYTDGYLAGDIGFGDYYYGPSVDGEIIRALPQEEFKTGHFAKVPLIVDRDGYEGVLFSNNSETTFAEEQADFQQLFPAAKPSFFQRLWQLYPASDYNSTFFQRQTVFGDFIIDCPTYYMATAVADAGLPVYKLIFDAGTELHGATTPYLWSATVPGDNVGVQGANITLGNIMKDWWLSFTVNLDPNVQAWSNASKPYWPTYMGGNMTFSAMDVNYTAASVDLDYLSRSMNVFQDYPMSVMSTSWGMQ
ncbi:alpha/beta-hydrolase [Calocera cornea HHB12733]|uniref:Alpha/beta-hydrolase n=1 Tax=Calocera cornea HHB12733 TaxID=1353952 RepID=A0A165EQ95_9BASI|nr:alpha/beta-hydrolase [Calocera cornea HHB12733]